MTATTTVPSAEAIALAEYLLGSLSSELDVIERAVEKALEDPMTLEEYPATDQQAVEARYADRPSPTRDELAPLLVFACDLESAAADMAERARKLRESVMALVHQADDRAMTPARWSEYRAMIAAWHAAQAEGGAS